MDLLELFRISFRALKTNKIRSFLTTLGIIIGVSSVILLVSIGNGLQEFVTKQFESLGTNVIYVMPGKIKFNQGGGAFGIVNKLELQDTEKIAKLGFPILTASSHYEKIVGVRYKGKTTDAEINGADINNNIVISQKLEKGEWFTRFQISTAKKTAIIGQTVIKNLKMRPNPIGEKITIGTQPYIIIAVLAKKGGALGADADNRIIIPSSTYIKYLGAKNPTTIMVKFQGEKNSLAAQNMIKKFFYKKKKLTDDDFSIFDQKELLNTINQFLGVITVALGGIAAISLLVGGIGIMNIMLVSVSERTREIGLRKAIGATPINILIQFLIEAVVLSLLGGTLGIILGAIGSLIMSQFIQTQVSTNSIFLAFGVSSFVGIFFGVAPAVKASRLSPIEALRYE